MRSKTMLFAIGGCIVLCIVVLIIYVMGKNNGQDDINDSSSVSPYSINFNEDDIIGNPDLRLLSHVADLIYLTGAEFSDDQMTKIWQFIEQLNYIETFQTEPKDGGVRASISIPVGQKTYAIQLRSPSNIEIYWSAIDSDDSSQSLLTGNRYTTDEAIFYEILTFVNLYYPEEWDYEE